LTGEPVQDRLQLIVKISSAEKNRSNVWNLYYRRKWNPMSQTMKLEITIHTGNNPYTETPFKTV